MLAVGAVGNRARAVFQAPVGALCASMGAAGRKLVSPELDLSQVRPRHGSKDRYILHGPIDPIREAPLRLRPRVIFPAVSGPQYRARRSAPHPC